MAVATERDEVCRRLFLLADNDSDGFIWRWVLFIQRRNDGHMVVITMRKMSLLVVVRMMILMRRPQLVGTVSGLTDSSMASPALEKAA